MLALVDSASHSFSLVQNSPFACHLCDCGNIAGRQEPLIDARQIGGPGQSWTPAPFRVGQVDANRKELFDKMAAAGVIDPRGDYKKAYTLQFVNKGVGVDLRPK